MEKTEGAKLQPGDILYKYVFDDDGTVHLYEMRIKQEMNKAGRVHAIDSERNKLDYPRGGYFFNVACIDEYVLDARRKTVVLSKEDFPRAKEIVLAYLKQRRDIAKRQYESAERRLANVEKSWFTPTLGLL